MGKVWIKGCNLQSALSVLSQPVNLKMVLFRIDRNHSDCVNVASVPLGRVPEALPGLMPPLALTPGLVSGGFFVGIGFALVKQLVGVDIEFTPLAVRWPPSTTEDGVSPPQSGASHFQARRNKYG